MCTYSGQWSSLHSPLGEALHGRDDEDSGDGGVELSVAQSHQVHHHTAAQHREKVAGHRLPKVQQKILYLEGE